MQSWKWFPRMIGAALLIAVTVTASTAQSAAPNTEGQPDVAALVAAAKAKTDEKKDEDKPKYPPYAEFLKEAKAFDGLYKLHLKDNKLYAEIQPGQLDQDLIVLISIAKGIGEGQILAGMSWGFGDDWIWQFRKVNDEIRIVRRNVRFKANSGSPEERAVRLAYTDSVVFSLPIATMSPSGNYVVDWTPVFMSDLPQIGFFLPGYSFARDKSTFVEPKTFKGNVEIEVEATYASAGMFGFDSVPDSRGATITVHYSLSPLPKTDYRPRLADDRVGYFLTALKDFSKPTDEERFVRYINRWNLQKVDPQAEMSEPKEPIVFYLEKTIPYPYRKPIRDGILAWNKAFEKAGFIDAVRVLDQPDDPNWHPEDIRYNTFRWITAGAGFAMGPSRVNPQTGQILDADIIFDADFINFWKQEYETFTVEGIANLTGGPLDLKTYQEELDRTPPHLRHRLHHSCDLHNGMTRELAFGSAVFAITSGVTGSAKNDEKLIMEGLKEVTMHEVGHTLGLRHNFKASTIYALEELNDESKVAETGMVGSVMDYNPTNIVSKDRKQGDYYTASIGPYDIWAIEYGYKALTAGTPEAELPELQKIAARCAEPSLVYSTDEDTRGIDSDPLSNRFDLGKDAVEYARDRAKLMTELWPGLVDRVTDPGEGYQKARQAFGILLGNLGRSLYFASRYVGGIEVNRDHKGDANGRAPFVIIPADKQRAALTLLEEQVFSDKPFQFPPDLYSHMASSRWSHWGTFEASRLDYAVHDVIGMWQDRVLQQVLSPLTLERIHDAELKVTAEQDVLTTAELIDRLTGAIFVELDGLQSGEFTNRKPAVSSIRRNLQRIYLRRLSNVAMGEAGAPDDCQTIAFVELEELGDRIKRTLEGGAKLDPYTRAHLKETGSRIQKVIEARLTLSGP